MEHTTLIIEKGKNVIFKGQVVEYGSIGRGAVKVNYGSNQVRLDLGREEGKQVSALFRDGRLSIKKKRDPREPLDEKVCDWLYEFFSSHCAPADDQPRRSCNPSITSMGNGVLQDFNVMANHYAGFTTDGFDKQCFNACSGGKKMTRTNFVKHFCSRRRAVN